MINGMDTRVIVRAVQDGLTLLEAEQNGGVMVKQTIQADLCDRYLTEDATDYDVDALYRTETIEEEEEDSHDE